MIKVGLICLLLAGAALAQDRQPSSRQGREAVAKYQAAVAAAEAAARTAMIAAEQQFVADLTTAVVAAMKNGQLEEANYLNDQKTQAAERLADLKKGGTGAGKYEILDKMTGGQKDDAGIVTLRKNDHLVSPERYKTPVAIRIIAQTDSTNIRIGYAADQIIFNWEMNPDELRIDGGPANRRYKRGAGRVPVNQWVTIDLIVLPDSLAISIDGEERYLTQADFSKISSALTIFPAAGSTVRVKSVLVRPL